MLLSWHWCSFPLPPQWEITGYSAFARYGDIDFHTRNGFMGRYSWRVLKKGVPDERATISAALRDHIKKYDAARAAELADPHFENAGIFTVGYYSKKDPCMACAFLPETQVLLQWIFPQWEPQTYRRDIAPMLAATAPHSGEFQDWAAFGLHITLPCDWKLVNVDPLPANVSMTWENAKHVQITMRRWGMASLMLEDYSFEMLARKVLLAQNAAVDEITNTTVGKYPGLHVEYRRRGQFGFEKIAGHWWTGTLDLWHNPGENRLYGVEQVGHRKLPRLDFAPLVAKLLQRSE